MENAGSTHSTEHIPPPIPSVPTERFQVLGPSFRVLGPSFRVLGPSFQVLGPSFQVLGPR
jgi:hypothetical protein